MVNRFSKLPASRPPKTRTRSAPRIARLARTLADRLHTERQRALVGRQEEIAVFQQLLSGRAQSLLLVSGQVGVGKSALLLEFQRTAAKQGHHVQLVDGNQFADWSSAWAESRRRLTEQLRRSNSRRSVLLVDQFEALGATEDAFLTEVAPIVAEDTLLVFGSRSGAPARLRVDPAWARLTRHCRLAPLSDNEATKLLELRGAPDAAHESVLDLCGGFPLALALAADHATRSHGRWLPSDCAQEVQDELAHLLSPASLSHGQQMALDLCALARSTTSELLEHVLKSTSIAHDTAPEDLFNWLRRQSFIESTRSGLVPHLMARLGLHARFRHERPRRYRAMTHVVREFCVAEIETGTSPGSDFVNLYFLDRDVPLIRRWRPDPPGSVPTSKTDLAPAHDSEHLEIVELVRVSEGEESAVLARASLCQAGESFEVARNDGLDGLLQYTRWGANSSPALAPGDPVAPILRRFLSEQPLRGDDETLLFRRFIHRHDYQKPTANVLTVTARLTQIVLAAKQVPYSFCVFRRPEEWAPLWKGIAMPWQVLDRFRLGEHEYSLVVFHWERRPLREVLVNAWRSGEAPGALPPSFDELRTKVAERVARLARAINLTPREIEILEFLCLGHSIDDIARALSIRPRTVKFHQENLLRKSGVNSRAELFRKLL